MSKLKTEKRCQTSRRNIGMFDSDVNVLSCCKLAEHMDHWFRNSTEVKRAMCNVSWPEAKCCPSAAMLANVTRLLAVFGWWFAS